MATSSSLNPLAHEFRPQAAFPCKYLPQPPHAVVGFPAAAPPPHHFFRGYTIHRVPAPTKKAAAARPPFSGKRRDSLKKLALPPRLRSVVALPPRFTATGMRKVWMKKVTSDGISAADGGDSPSPAVPAKTTVMIRHIPNQYRRDSFMEFLDKYCLQNHLEYDFLYLPMDFKTKNNVGYAFVNFTTTAAAAKIKERLQNYQWSVLRTPTGFFTSKKICEVTWARIQGKKELVKHFQKSNFVCDTSDYLPAVFSPPRDGSLHSSGPKPIGNLMGNVRTRPCKA